MDNIPASVLALCNKMDPVSFGKMIAAIMTECGKQSNTLESPKVVEKSLSKEELAPAEVRIVSAEVKPASAEVKPASAEVKPAPAEVISSPAKAEPAPSSANLALAPIEDKSHVTPKEAAEPTKKVEPKKEAKAAEPKQTDDSDTALDELLEELQTEWFNYVPSYELCGNQEACRNGLICAYISRGCWRDHVSLPSTDQKWFVPRRCSSEQETGVCAHPETCCCLHTKPKPLSKQKPVCRGSEKKVCFHSSQILTELKNGKNEGDLSILQMKVKANEVHNQRYECYADSKLICSNDFKDHCKWRDCDVHSGFICRRPRPPKTF